MASISQEVVYKSGTPVLAATPGTPLNHLALVASRALRLQVPAGLSQTETVLNRRTRTVLIRLISYMRPLLQDWRGDCFS